ncbi:FAD-dependent tricarballylate dehydrogenase TcuA [Endozoicomonas arenosclerae]|uniref:FAD-dependent tricarballylate dehydrogenase TcuA n=1 Tax=Endozoicomonas arenosclerae TaxID=1633495 RepID=UPI0007841F5D|nr:FAD-dependent tricarballylate dehydrogenase TcuA [Endozoicomonas arenosclerae]
MKIDYEQNSRPGAVIVAGTGNAALSAAIAAREKGAIVKVFDQADYANRGGNSRLTAAVLRIALESSERVELLLQKPLAENVQIEPYDSDLYFMEATASGKVDEQLIRWIVRNSYSSMYWLVKHGLELELSDHTYTTAARIGEQVYSGGLILQAKGEGEGLINAELRILEAMGGTVQYESRVVDLVRSDQDGAVIGACIEDSCGKQWREYGKVILGSGGFEANRQMVKEHLGEIFAGLKQRCVPYNTGLLTQKALDLGAMPYGHWQGCHCSPIDVNAPDSADHTIRELTNRVSFVAGIIVNREGRRFTDEGANYPPKCYVAVALDTLHQTDQLGFQIFDQQGVRYLDNYYQAKGVTREEAQTLPKLASQLGINAQNLVETVESFNLACQKYSHLDYSFHALDACHTAGVTPPKSNWARPITEPPYVAYPYTAGLTYTFGGLKINQHAQVLDCNGLVIEGLYACGEAVGGVNYMPFYIAGQGLVKGTVTGMHAGHHAAI